AMISFRPRPGTFEGGLTVWDLDGKELFNLDEEGIDFRDPVLSPDGTRVAAVRWRRGAEGGGVARVQRSDARGWDIATGRALATTPVCMLVTFDPDGNRPAGVARSPDQSVRAHLWDAVTGEERARLEMPARAASAGSIAFSPDGRRIAATIGLRGQPES